jgi:hypothetical protein
VIAFELDFRSFSGTPDVIQSLWIGERLSRMEQLSIRSFLHHGHPFHLYVYDDIGNAPAGTVLCDASKILPREAIFRYRDHDSYAGFANYFRYKLLLERGGWWVDTDMVCLKPFDFRSEYVFSSQRTEEGTEVVNVGAIKAPQGSPFAARAWAICESRDPASITWGETGPLLAASIVTELGLDRFVRSADTFCPVDYMEWERILNTAGIRFGRETYGVHLWNELWRRAGVDKDARHDECLYVELQRRYGGRARSGLARLREFLARSAT